MKKNFPAFSHKLHPVSAREHRLNFVMLDRSMAALLRPHLAFDHSSINCAINWGARNRGLLLRCLANTFVLHVFGASANISVRLHTSNSSAAKSETPPKQFQGLGCGKGLISIHLHDLFIACSDLRIRLCTEEETSAGQPVQTSRRISSWLNYNGVVSVVNQPWSFVSLGT